MTSISRSGIDADGTSSQANVVATLVRQFRTLRPFLLTVYLPTILSLAILVFVHVISDIPISYFMIDPAAEFNAPMYVGCFSNFGVLIWCSTAAVCLFSGGLLFVDGTVRETSLFILCSGLMTSVLMFDDLFMLHEEVLPDHFFIPQPVVFLGYIGMIVAYLYRFRQVILSTDYLPLLLLALGFFGMSAFVDLFVTPEEFQFAGLQVRYLIEDGLKLLGIVSWATYFICVCFQQIHDMRSAA